MSPESHLPDSSEAPVSPLDVEPTTYIETLRSIMKNESVIVKSPVSPKVGAQMYFEEEKSRAFLSEEGVLDETKGAEETQWIEDGFSALMGRIVKVTARAETAGCGIVSFASLGAQSQDKLRRYALEEYLELCDLMSPGDKPSKAAYTSSAFFYITPQEASNIIEDNADLGKGHVARMIQTGPLRVARWVEETRDKIEEAVEKFPTIPRTQIKLLVIGSPENYEASIRRHAEKHGIVLDTHEAAQDIPAAKDFLEAVRHLIQARKYDLGHLNPPPELVETARKIGHEAVAAMDATEAQIEGLNESDLSDPVLKEGYQKKVEWLVWAANRAWRHGDLPISPERAPEEFRRELYATMLGDFLKIHVELGGNISEIAMRDNLVLHMDPEEVHRILEQNSDITMNYLRTIMRRNPGNPDEAILEFRARVKKLMDSNPRLLYYEAVHTAFNKPRQEIRPVPEEAMDIIPPDELLAVIRDYLLGTARLGMQRSRDITFEIEERHAEIKEFFESRNWDFGSMELPEAGRRALIHKVEELIVANERAHRKREITTRLRDYTEEERLALYEIVAKEYAAIANILDPKSNVDWSRNPVLYVSATELAQMRADYSWLTDSNFRRVVMSGVRDVGVALERATRLRSDLIKWYPGISDALASNLAVGNPNTGSERFMELLRKSSERSATRSDSRTEIPNPTKPDELYRHLRTLCRRESLSTRMPFDAEVEKQITELRTRAADRVTRQEKLVGIDEQNLRKFLDQLEFYVRGSEARHVQSSEYPSVLDLSASVQNRFITVFYNNYRELHELIAGGSVEKQVRIYDFAFFHSAGYMRTLWREYTPYMPQKLVILAALTSPKRPIDKLNDLVEYRGQLLRQSPDLNTAEINKALLEHLRNKK